MRRNSIDCLSPEVRKTVRHALYARSFRDYAGLAAELAAQGHMVSKSALHRYGRKLEEAVKAAELATLVQGDLPQRNEARHGIQLDLLDKLESEGA
jgi:hypothetical protein